MNGVRATKIESITKKGTWVLMERLKNREVINIRIVQKNKYIFYGIFES